MSKQHSGDLPAAGVEDPDGSLAGRGRSEMSSQGQPLAVR